MITRPKLDLVRARAMAATVVLLDFLPDDDKPKIRKVFVPKALDPELVARIEKDLTPVDLARYRPVWDLEVHDWKQTKNSSIARRTPGRKLWNVT